MTRTFMEYESEQYYKKSPEQVALTDYAGKKGFLNILKKLTNNNGDISIIEGMDKIKHKLNNFIPKFNCYCSNPAEYFSLQRIVEKRYNLYLREEVFNGKPKTKENCDNFLHNLSIREDIREYKKPSRVYVDAENKSIQLYLL